MHKSSEKALLQILDNYGFKKLKIAINTIR